MSNVSPLPSPAERKERRRLHLREVTQDSVEAPEAPRDPASLLGATLRAARLGRGEDAASVASTLRMRRDQLEAIEEDDFAKLPGRTYAVGFVRAYARYLGLDAEAMVQRFKDESASREIAKPVELVFPEAPEERRVMLPNGSLLIWAMLIAIVIYGISYLTMPARKQPATTASADVPAVIIEDPAPAPASEPGASTTLDVWRPVSSEPPVTYVAGEAMLPANDAPSTTEILVDDRTLPAATFTIAQVTDVTAHQSQTPDAATSRITLTALELTYIQIRDPTQRGKRGVLVSRLLNPGESYAAPDRVGLIMQTGNAGGLQVAVDGRVLGVLGKRGEVITRIPLDASYFLERLAASQ
jgi:cytoskeleton protein RodZ